MIPMAAVILVLSDQITQVLYQRGAFDASQTDLVSEALFYFAFSLPFAGVNLLLIRTFFSLQRPWVPTAIALANLGVNAGLDAILYKPIGIGGIPLSTAIVSLITSLALAAVLRPRLGGIEGRRILDSGVRMLVAAGALAGGALLVREALEGVVGEGFGGQLVLVLVVGTAAMAVYLAAVFALRLEEAGQLWRLARGQLGRRD
jgi:putative peptidoglycan lipid II flippase